MSPIPNFSKAHCNLCGGERNHVVLHRVDTQWQEEDGRHAGTDTYQTLQCAGCDAIKLRHQATFPYEPYESIDYFPAAIFRPRPKWFDKLIFQLSLDTTSIIDLLNEIYVALQHNLLRTASMGVRALLETVMVSKVGDHKSFGKNVDAFEKAGYVSRVQRESLVAILEAGHATIHRDFQPSRQDVVTLVDIAEHIVEAVFVHEPQVKQLERRVPKRI
jgi:Domain of unknown function (DUF4145)